MEEKHAVSEMPMHIEIRHQTVHNMMQIDEQKQTARFGLRVT